MLAALQKVRASAPFGEIKDRLATDPGSVHLLPDWSKFQSVRKAASAEDTYVNIIVDAAKTVPQFRGSFTLSNQRAVDLAARQAAGLAYGLSQDSQAAIRTAISLSLQGNFDTRQAALLIRDAIGLTPARVQAVANYRAALDRVAAGTSDAKVVQSDFALSGRVAQSLSPMRVDQMVDKYALRQLQDRAVLVARTETMSAANLGQLEIWREAADKGLIDRSSAKRVWVATDDDRECDICMELDGTEISLDGSYGTSETPPAHPNCRCTESLVTDQPDG